MKKHDEKSNRSDYNLVLNTILSKVRKHSRKLVIPYAENAASYFEQERMQVLQGRNAFIDHYFVYTDLQNDTFYSEATWTEGIESFIPQADYVSFLGKVKRIDHVPWDAVSRIVGNRMEPTELSPIRFRVNSFPEQDEITALRAYETDKSRYVFPLFGCDTIYSVSCMASMNERQ